MFATVFSCLLAAIALPGVKGERLVTRAFLDANNVRVGDPLVLTVDFLGDADFSALHPPALASRVDTRFWRIDDRSAKTETVESARRLVYRVRPMREGCYDFPSLAFAYVDGSSGATNTIRTQPLPVHVKAGAQAALAALEDESAENALPDGLFVDLSHSPWRSGAALSADARFAWRRACAQPSAAAFAAFGFPEARLNAAACELMEGHWAKAKAIYESLEWRIGQTPAVSRGLRAVQVLATGDPAAELPAWRQALHPVLRYGWRRRLACLGALSLAVALLLFARSPCPFGAQPGFRRPSRSPSRPSRRWPSACGAKWTRCSRMPDSAPGGGLPRFPNPRSKLTSSPTARASAQASRLPSS